jgi:hypothetical protein
LVVTRLGYYLPWAVFGSVLMASSCGLLSIMSPSTSTAEWAGLQVLLGAGRGGMLLAPITAVQNAVPPMQIALAISLVMFSQTFGGTMFLAASNTILSNSLKTQIPKYAPSVDVQTVISAGATGVRNVVSATDLEGVLRAYAKSIDGVFYLVAGSSIACFVFSLGIGWKDIRVKKSVESV